MPKPDLQIDRRGLMLAAGGWLTASAASASSSPRTPSSMARCCPVLELRQYTLHGGRRDELIALFDREFVETQEAVGARVLGQFRDLDDPDRFVWLRGFESMEARRQALEAFYGGPAWQAHRSAANATMLDSDNVLLLRPAGPEAGFEAPVRGAVRRPGVIAAAIHYMDDAHLPAFAAYFTEHMRPLIEADGAPVLGAFVTETAENTFPRLPLRTGDRVFVWFSRFASRAEEAAFRARRARRSGWRDAAPETLLPAFARKAEWLRLSPTPRSALA